ncbi:MAG: YciI family protein [Terriglobales bacterium]
MKFLCIYKPADTKKSEAGIPPSPQEIAKMGEFCEEMAKAGVLLATEGCMPTSKGARLRLSAGKFTVTDGPFTESKELIAGFALLQTQSKQEAIDLTRRFLKVAGDGECEIRQIFEAGDCAQAASYAHDTIAATAR